MTTHNPGLGDVHMQAMTALTALLDATLVVPRSDELAAAAAVDEHVALVCLEELRNAFIDGLIGAHLQTRPSN